jgi:GAF domain-containing protein
MPSRRKPKSQRPEPRSGSWRPVPKPSTPSSVRRRSTLVAEVAQCLRQVDDADSLLSRVARACLPELAELCIVDVARDDGTIERIEAAHIDPSKAEIMRDALRNVPSTNHPAREVFESGRAVLTPEVGDELLSRIARDAPHRVLLRQFGPKSQMRLPVTVRGRTIAVVTFSITDSSRRFDRSDLRLAEEIIARVVTALEEAS